jgi:hypothetical protein
MTSSKMKNIPGFMAMLDLFAVDIGSSRTFTGADGQKARLGSAGSVIAQRRKLFS